MINTTSPTRHQVEPNLDRLEPSPFSPSVNIKEIHFKEEGITLKYERFHRGKFAQGVYPKKGDLSSNYSNTIDETAREIAVKLLSVCGLSNETWNNDTLHLDKVCFYNVEAKNGTTKLTISGAISSLNELIGLTVKMNVPKLPFDVFLECELKLLCERLLEAAVDFYNGKTKYHQESLF